jgi:hypothetical protein
MLAAAAAAVVMAAMTTFSPIGVGRHVERVTAYGGCVVRTAASRCSWCRTDSVPAAARFGLVRCSAWPGRRLLRPPPVDARLPSDRRSVGRRVRRVSFNLGRSDDLRALVWTPRGAVCISVVCGLSRNVAVAAGAVAESDACCSRRWQKLANVYGNGRGLELARRSTIGNANNPSAGATFAPDLNGIIREACWGQGVRNN